MVMSIEDCLIANGLLSQRDEMPVKKVNNPYAFVPSQEYWHPSICTCSFHFDV